MATIVPTPSGTYKALVRMNIKFQQLPYKLLHNTDVQQGP